MASTQMKLLLCSAILLVISHSTFAQHTSFRPKALILPVSKDPSTLQYVTHIKQRSPLVPVKLTVDLGGEELWVDCEHGYVSSSYERVLCNSAQCNIAIRSQACTASCYDNPEPGCSNKSYCTTFPDNSVIRLGTAGQFGFDVVSVQSTDGSNPDRVVSFPKVLFTCGATFLLERLASGVTGMAGFGRSKIALPLQFSAAFSFRRKFAICLAENGVVIFGDGPYVLLPGIDVSKSLSYTPLILNKVSTAGSYFEGEPSTDYFIGVKSIEINSKAVPLNTSLLSINNDGFGGTKISTVNPYTVMETTIYNAFIKSFSKALSGVPRAASVAPFGLCFDGTKIGSTRVGPAVPFIDLVLPNKVKWTISGSNSMVSVGDGVLCVGFVDGGVNPRTSIVIGGHQLENLLLQFDLAASRLGFSSSLLFSRTTCANFNFTSKA